MGILNLFVVTFDFLFASLGNKTFPTSLILSMERICSLKKGGKTEDGSHSPLNFS